MNVFIFLYINIYLEVYQVLHHTIPYGTVHVKIYLLLRRNKGAPRYIYNIYKYTCVAYPLRNLDASYRNPMHW